MGAFDNLGDDIVNGFNSIVATGAPAIIAGAEDYAAKQLQQASAQNKAVAVQIAQKSPPATGIMASIQNAFGVTQATAFVKTNWVYILGGLAVVGTAIYFYKKR